MLEFARSRFFSGYSGGLMMTVFETASFFCHKNPGNFLGETGVSGRIVKIIFLVNFPDFQNALPTASTHRKAR